MISSNGSAYGAKLNVQKPKRVRSVSPVPSRAYGQKLNPGSKSYPQKPASAGIVRSYKDQNGKRTDSVVLLPNKEPTTIINNAYSKPPMKLLIVSNKCKSSAFLEKSVNADVVAVLYNWDSVTYDSLLALISCSLDTGQQVSSVACMMTCKPSGMLMANLNQKMGVLNNNTSLSPKSGAGKFFKILFERFVDTRLTRCRLDLIASGCQHDGFVQQLQKLLGIPVYLSKELLASDQFVETSEHKRTVGEMYFQADKLRNWSSGSYQTLDLFEKIRMVGKGAFGTAVLYKKKDDHSLVVLKEINMTELNNQERLMAMNEARVLGMLNHPNIICYYDTFEANGVLMIEMEYADDGTLAQYLSRRESPLEEKTILGMFTQIVSGLAYMHEQKVLHRDLKTANIFLTKEGLLKIGDFGVSKIMTSRNNAANTVLGTPYYISPEICEGKPYDAKSDIWALGCILYEMATRQRTFEGTNLPALVNKIMNGQIAPIRGDYSVEMRKLVKDMLNKDPEQRPTASNLETKMLPELMSRYPCEERPHFTPGSRGSGERKQAEGTRSVLYLYNTSLMNITLVDGMPSKIKIRQVAVGHNHVVVVAMERVVYTWGDNSFGQLGHGHMEYVAKPLLVDALKGKSVTTASCGANFSVFVSDNGIAMTCGDGQQGCLGHSNLNGTTRPRLIESLLPIDVASVACGDSHVVVLGTDGEVYTWGCGGHGRLGTGDEEDTFEPTRIHISQAIREVRCASDATIFVTEIGTLLACGNNNFNKLGLNERTGFLAAFQNKLKKTEVEYRKVPTAVKSIKGVLDVAMAKTHTVVLTEPDQVWVMGSNKEGQMATKDVKPRPSPYLVKCLKDQEVMVVACGNAYTAVGTTNGTISFWGTRFGPIESGPGQFLQPPSSEKLHKRTQSTGSTLSIRSISSFQQDSASECASRTSSLQDISFDEPTDTESQSLNNSHSNDLRLPETFFSPVPILNIQSSQSSAEDLSAFLDNLIPFRENLFILVETNAPVTYNQSAKEKRRKSNKDKISMENLKHSLSSNDDTSSEASEMDSTPTWIKNELADAKKDEWKSAGKTGKLSVPSSLSASSSARVRKVSANARIRKQSARSDSSSDSSVRSQLTSERRVNSSTSSNAPVARGRPRDSSPGRSKAKPSSAAYLQPKKSPRATSSRSPTRSPVKLSAELDRLAKEKRDSDKKLEQLRKEHEEKMNLMRASHEKEKFEQEQKMLDEIQQLREELQNLSQRQVEISRRSSDRAVSSKICVVQ